MKTHRSKHFTTSMIAILAGLALSSGTLLAQEPPEEGPAEPPEEAAEPPEEEAEPMEQEHQPVEVDDDKVEAFARAYLALTEVREDYSERLQDTEDSEEIQSLQHEASDAMAEAIEDAGLEVDEYQEIAAAMSADPELRDKITEKVSRLREE